MYIVAKPRVAGTHRWVTSLSELTCKSSVIVAESAFILPRGYDRRCMPELLSTKSCLANFEPAGTHEQISCEIALESSRKGSGSAAPPEEVTGHTH